MSDEEKTNPLVKISTGLKNAGSAILNGADKVVDVVTYPVGKLDKTVKDRAELLHTQHNDGWARVAEGSAVVTGTANQATRALVWSGGEPQVAVASGVRAAVAESLGFVNGENPTMRKLEKQGCGSRENLATEFKEFLPKFINEPMPSNKKYSTYAQGMVDGLLGIDPVMSFSLSHFEDFKEAGGKMSELSKQPNSTIAEYLDKKAEQHNKEAGKAPKAVPVEEHDNQKSKSSPRKFGPRADNEQPKNNMANNDPEQQNSQQTIPEDRQPHLDAALAKVDTSSLKMAHDSTTQGVAEGYKGAGAQVAQTSTVQV